METTTADPYALFARYYDIEYAAIAHDLDLYLQFAVEANGPVLELGCGTGRVLRTLEPTGLPLTGVDTSHTMLNIARERVSSSTSLILGDMRHADKLSLPHAPYWLAFSAINTFLHLPDARAQLEALRAIRRVVIGGGLLLLDLMIPDPAYLAALEGRVMHELTAQLPAGQRLDKWVSRTHDLAEQTIDTTVWFDETSEVGEVRRTVDRYLTRYIHRFELEHLLELAGWRLIALYGGYELEPFTSDAERMIALATWGDTASSTEEVDYGKT